tara:strand:- start:235 stop:357 length:123 start_codon:yes stop_codon:yes gene_type:complete
MNDLEDNIIMILIGIGLGIGLGFVIKVAIDTYALVSTLPI